MKRFINVNVFWMRWLPLAPAQKMIRKPKFSLRVNVLETLTEGFRNVGDRHNGVRIALAHDRFEGVELSTG